MGSCRPDQARPCRWRSGYAHLRDGAVNFAVAAHADAAASKSCCMLHIAYNDAFRGKISPPRCPTPRTCHVLRPNSPSPRAPSTLHRCRVPSHKKYLLRDQPADSTQATDMTSMNGVANGHGPPMYVWIDCDAGVDDAQGACGPRTAVQRAALSTHTYSRPAREGPTPLLMSILPAGLMIALSMPNVHVIGISCVHGNVVSVHELVRRRCAPAHLPTRPAACVHFDVRPLLAHTTPRRHGLPLPPAVRAHNSPHTPRARALPPPYRRSSTRWR